MFDGSRFEQFGDIDEKDHAPIHPLDSPQLGRMHELNAMNFDVTQSKSGDIINPLEDARFEEEQQQEDRALMRSVGIDKVEKAFAELQKKDPQKAQEVMNKAKNITRMLRPEEKREEVHKEDFNEMIERIRVRLPVPLQSTLLDLHEKNDYAFVQSLQTEMIRDVLVNRLRQYMREKTNQRLPKRRATGKRDSTALSA
ncbi:MAG TPA: hypothetical protein VEA18_00835 [Candidatus Kapabacteria bacterium]|nr:hypothetical protein [Candidatus Kapabacteria bacterium]